MAAHVRREKATKCRNQHEIIKVEVLDFDQTPYRTAVLQWKDRRIMMQNAALKNSESPLPVAMKLNPARFTLHLFRDNADARVALLQKEEDCCDGATD
jgi:hypothetical protein